MTEVGGMNLEMRGRKRKLPFNWDDVYHSSSEDEKNIIKKKLLEANFNLHATFQSSSEDEEDSKKAELRERGCVLCGHLNYGGCNVSDNIESSQHSYGDVLQKLLTKTSEFEEQQDVLSFEEGTLCTICKVRLQNLYRLQKELREEKIDIMNIFKESQNVRKERRVEKNVEQIISEMRNAKKVYDRKKKRMFKNNSDSHLDYTATVNEKPPIKPSKPQQRTPEQNKSNIKRFTIQSLKKRSGDSYLVKWDGYSDEENTWELRSLIPEYILKYYEENPERLGLPAPSVPDKFNPSVFDDSQDSENEENVKKSENFDINSIINGLYKEDKRKSTMSRKPSEDFYMQENSHDRPLKKRLASGNNGGPKFLTKAALKYSDPEGSESQDEMKSLIQKEEAVSNFNISFDNNSSKNDSPNKSDIIDESPQAAKEKDSKKTKVLGKIFVSTPDRRRSAEHKSEEMIKAVLQEEDIYTIESLVAKKGSKYLVKWENFPHDQNTWEPRSAIPPFIVKFYEQDLSRLGREVPAPPSSGSEYIPAVDSLNEISDSGYERDDDWRPKVRIRLPGTSSFRNIDKKRRRKSGSNTKKSSKAANDSINHKEKDVKSSKRK